ncbi:winged helix DNA-binding protein [Spartinivicinus ruber]|uniref:winged helix DNA-binding protein n=1 Tax=Spartinivicinus ruber TaxID=2683272 RepID=UPI0013D17A49|nr:winged helix DNA-binding protein [Spartinivicinus ruber]
MADDQELNSIVSSSHLVSELSRELSEFEYGLTIANNSFQRWMLHCSSSSGVNELTPLDVLVIHHINHRERPKKVSDICFILNLEDTHTISYSVRKLVSLGMIVGTKQGKETFYNTTESGQDYCQKYRKIREACLVNSLKALNLSNKELGEVANALRMLSGIYDQASRAAASL